MAESQKTLTALLISEKGTSIGEEISVNPVLSRNPVFIIGSDPRSHLTLSDAQVAPSHAGISLKDNQYMVRAILPKLEVYVNGIPVDRIAALKPGDVIRMGTAALRFTLEERDEELPLTSPQVKPAVLPARAAHVPTAPVPRPVFQTASVAAVTMPSAEPVIYFPATARPTTPARKGGYNLFSIVGVLVTVAVIAGFIGTMLNSSRIAPGSRGTVPIALMGSGDGLTLMMFTADWCPYCRQQRPIVNKLAREYAGDMTVSYIDIDDSGNRRLVQEHDARSIPLIVIMDSRGNVIATYRGLQREDTLRRTIDQAL